MTLRTLPGPVRALSLLALLLLPGALLAGAIFWAVRNRIEHYRASRRTAPLAQPCTNCP